MASEFFPPQAPPTAPGPLVMERPSAWPTVLGIIGTIVGVLALLGGLGGSVSWYFIEAFGFRPPGAADTLAAVKEWKGLSIGSSLVSALVAAMLVAGSIGLLKRCAWSPGLLKLWAVLRILVAALAAVVALLITQSQFDAMRAEPGAVVPPQSLMKGIAVFGAAFTLLWGSALPVFMLIWLARPVIKLETSAWR